MNEKEFDLNLTDIDIDGIYKYLSISMDTMDNQELLMWISILEKYDPEYTDTQEDEEI